MDVGGFQVMPFVSGDDPEETVRLQRMADEAIAYLKSFSWCPDIANEFMAYGTGDVVALFYVEFCVPLPSGDEGLWVVVGDVPSAYFVTDAAPDARTAMDIYCDLMSAWVEAVEDGRPLDDVFPVRTDATPENAAALRARIDFIRREIIPSL